MYYLALFDSGNYVFSLSRVLEKKGYVFEIVSTPCHIAKGGCSYCLKFPGEFMDMVISEGKLNNTTVREIFKVIPLLSKNRYEKIYSRSL